MAENRSKLVIGFITYGETTAKYLPYFLPTIQNQSFKDHQIICIDNSEIEDNANKKIIRGSSLEVDFRWAGDNLGFAKAYNVMINKAIKLGSDYFLAVNPDMMLEPDMAEQLISTIEQDSMIAAVQPKILKWDFGQQRKTGVIDSCGLTMDKKHRFFDKRQGEIDQPQAHDSTEIFGFTGAAVLFNLKALIDVAYNNEFFDELMFMYKEDCDLSYRLRLAGWKIILEPSAVAYHDRSASIVGLNIINIALNRKNKSKQVKKWSFLNQLILLIKYKSLPLSFSIKIMSWLYEVESIVFALVFESYLIKELFKIRILLPEIKKRREALKIRVKMEEIEKFI